MYHDLFLYDAGIEMSISVIVSSFGVGMFIGMLGWGLSRVGSMYSRMLH